MNKSRTTGPKKKTVARAAVAAVLVAAGVLTTTPARAGGDRMQLACEAGTLTGHTLERTNGSSGWDQADGTVYTAKSITVRSEEEGTVYDKQYGKKASDAETCIGTHFDYTWDLEVVEAGR